MSAENEWRSKLHTGALAGSSPVQDIEISAILLLDQVAEETLRCRVEVPERVNLGVTCVLEHLDALGKGQPERLEHRHLKRILLADNCELLA